MKIRYEQDTLLSEVELVIRYSEMTKEVEHISTTLGAIEKKVHGRLDDEERLISVSDIFYFESVDKKTFIYCKNDVYQSDRRLYQLAEDLAHLGFVQISKSTILNIHWLDSIKSLLNSRIEAVLKNGEKLLVTRKYLDNIRQALQGDSV